MQAEFADPVSLSGLLRHRSVHGFWVSERVRWNDTDLVGHVNNLSITNYCEIGRVNFLQPWLLPGAPERALFLIVRMTTNFLGEVHWPGVVDVGTSVLEVGRSSVRVVHAVFDGERCVATADSVLVHIDEASRASHPIPEAVLDYFSQYRSVWTEA